MPRFSQGPRANKSARVHSNTCERGENLLFDPGLRTPPALHRRDAKAPAVGGGAIFRLLSRVGRREVRTHPIFRLAAARLRARRALGAPAASRRRLLRAEQKEVKE